jgi:hypothetical protein
MRLDSSPHPIRRRAALALVALGLVQLPPAGVAHSRTTTTALPADPQDEGILTGTLSLLGGLALGQSIRFTVFNPGEPDPRLSSGPLRARVTLFDAEGRLIVESQEAEIAAGAFRSFDFDRRDIALPGEQGTGRLQVRGTIRVEVRREARGHPIAAAMEVVDHDTGRTAALSPYVPILVVAKRVVG